MIEQLLLFISNHWILSGALALTVLLIGREESKNKAGGLKLSLHDATHLINHEHAILIDLRAANAFAQGHMVNALNFPEATIISSLDKLKKYQLKPIILVDAAGQQANRICHQLRKQGYDKAYCLMGGLATWTNAGLPLIK